MIEALARFVEELRGRGIRPSPAETIDAARAVRSVGIENRETFRAALASTLAKHRSNREAFDAAFDAFFTAPDREAGKRRGRRRAKGAGPGRSVRRTTEDGEGRRGTRDGRGRSLSKTLDEARKSGSRTGRLRKIRLSPRGTDAGSDATTDPARREIRNARGTDEERELARSVPEIVERLRLRAGRRLARSSHGRLWARRVFRENLSRGGVPFVLPYRRRRPKRPNVVLLVDVSYSVARSAGYFLWIATEFLRPGRRARVFLFVDRPVDATREIEAWTARRGRNASAPAGTARGPGSGIERGGVSFSALLSSLDGLNLTAASDYGRAFHALYERFPFRGGRDTVLVILGDARTNRFDPLPWTLEDMCRRCRAVLWLVPEPRNRWGTGDSALASYLDHVDVLVEAPDLGGLERGVGEILRRI